MVAVEPAPNLGLYRLEFAELLLRVVEEHRPPDSIRERAACRGHDVDVFVPRNPGTVPPAALATCSRCPVADDCRAWARSRPVPLEGIWGGETARERRQANGRDRPVG